MNAPRRCFSFSTYFTTKKLRTRVVDQQHEPTLGSPQVEYELLPTDLESSSRWAVAKVLPNGGAGLFFVGPKKTKKIQLKGKEWEDARIHWHLLRDGLLSPPDPRDPRGRSPRIPSAYGTFDGLSGASLWAKFWCDLVFEQRKKGPWFKDIYWGLYFTQV